MSRICKARGVSVRTAGVQTGFTRVGAREGVEAVGLVASSDLGRTRRLRWKRAITDAYLSSAQYSCLELNVKYYSLVHVMM